MSMPVIRPISDLRNNFNIISDISHKNAESVFTSSGLRLRKYPRQVVRKVRFSPHKNLSL